MDRQEPRRWPPSHRQADVVRFGVSVPYPWKQPRSSSDLICAALGFRCAFCPGRGCWAFARSDHSELLHLEGLAEPAAPERNAESQARLTFSV